MSMRSRAALADSFGRRRSSIAWSAASESVKDFLTFRSAKGRGLRPCPRPAPPCLAVEPDDFGILFDLSAELLGNVCSVSNAVGLCILRAGCPFAADKLLGALAHFGFADECPTIGDDVLAHLFSLSDMSCTS